VTSQRVITHAARDKNAIQTNSTSDFLLCKRNLVPTQHLLRPTPHQGGFFNVRGVVPLLAARSPLTVYSEKTRLKSSPRILPVTHRRRPRLRYSSNP
jgi:hypothetical protein